MGPKRRADDTDYTRAIGSRWLTSAVARIFRPGAKADCCLILEGPQGIRKSTALRTIAGEYFTDEVADLGSKDAAMQTRGVWIIELSELDSLSHAEVARIKAFMSRTTDRFRPPYGMRLVESPRQCVFAGTVNRGIYLRDETGGRRIWPVVCGQIDVEGLAGVRDQCRYGYRSVVVSLPAESVGYAGRQSGFPGLDQINVTLPRSLAGRGLANVHHRGWVGRHIVRVSIR